jgi:hypothetical protein
MPVNKAAYNINKSTQEEKSAKGFTSLFDPTKP